MKMTDESALAVLNSIVGHLRPILGADSYDTLLAAREHIAARLAADQQKGGGEVDRERTLTAARFRAACYALKEVVEGASGEVWRSESGERLKDRAEWVAFYNLTSNMRERGGPDPYATPQPSIPAPAQQDIRFLARNVAGWVIAALGDLTTDYQAMTTEDVEQALLANLEHAPQQDGKASGGEAIEALAVRVENLLTAWGDMDMWEERDAIAADLRALAHPPHADQETQG